MTLDNCIFCKIANGEIPTRQIYNDDDFRVILDMGPATKGHALILPKEHAANIFELSDEIGAKVLPLAKAMCIKMKETLNCEGVNLVQNNGECAGQTVNHFHLHIIPRYKDDNQKILWEPREASAEELDEILHTITQG